MGEEDKKILDGKDSFGGAEGVPQEELTGEQMVEKITYLIHKLAEDEREFREREDIRNG